MNIYLLTQTENEEYDSYDSIVVCAEDEIDAKTILPETNMNDEEVKSKWVIDTDFITCIEIGKANSNQVKGVILASYHAG